MSSEPTSPASLFGGTWERIKDTFILAAGDTYAAGSTGGEAAHTLTGSEMPSHSHNGYGADENSGDIILKNAMCTYRNVGISTRFVSNGAIITNLASGGSQPHNNMPPYTAMYVWKRIA